MHKYGPERKDRSVSVNKMSTTDTFWLFLSSNLKSVAKCLNMRPVDHIFTSTVEVETFQAWSHTRSPSVRRCVSRTGTGWRIRTKTAEGWSFKTPVRRVQEAVEKDLLTNLGMPREVKAGLTQGPNICSPGFPLIFLCLRGWTICVQHHHLLHCEHTTDCYL